MIKRWRPTPVTQINNAELQYRVEKVEKMAVDPQDVCNLFKKLPRGRIPTALGNAKAN